jgi:Flp pilus assembly protein TadD
VYGTSQQSAGSLSQDQLIKLIKTGASAEAMVNLVQKYGINFQPDVATLERLKKEGAPDVLLEAIQHASPPPPPKAAPATPLEDTAKMLEAERHLKLSQLKAQDKDFDGALAELEEAEKIRPQWSEVLYQRGLVLAELHRYREAANEWNKYLSIAGPEADLKTVKDKITEWEYQADKGEKSQRLTQQGEQNLKHFDAEAAVPEFQELVKIQPSLKNLLLLAEAFWLKRDYESLSKTAAQALALDANSPQAILYEGAAELGQGRIASAPSIIQRGINLDPKLAYGHELFCDALIAEKDWKNARLQCDQALQINPNSGFAFDRLGIILWNQKNYNGALEEYRKAAQSEPENAYWQSDLAYALLNLGNVSGALEAARGALRVNSRCPYSHDAMGMVLQAQGNIEGAIAEFSEAIKLAPPPGDPLFAKHLNEANQKMHTVR